MKQEYSYMDMIMAKRPINTLKKEGLAGMVNFFKILLTWNLRR